MPRENIITGIDIGSHYIDTVVASVDPSSPVLNIVGLGRVKSEGITKGNIVDIKDASESIKASVKEAENASGYTIGKSYISIGGEHIISMPSKGVVAVSRADEEITQDDIDRVVSSAKTIAIPKNKEILHNIPRDYIVDGEAGLRDAIGLRGQRLEANTLIIGGSTAHIRSIKTCIENTDIDPTGFVLAPLAASDSVLSKKQKELGVLCLDIGGGTTSMAVFEEGNLIHTKVFPVGGENITKDIAIGLRVDAEIAEQIKKEYGVSLSSEVNKNDTVDISQFNPEDDYAVSRKQIAEIIEMRLTQIMDAVNKELRSIGKEAFLPGGVVLVGGSAKLPHIVDLSRSQLRLPVQIGFPRNVEGVTVSVEDPSYATMLGLVLKGYENPDNSSKLSSLPGKEYINKIISKLKKWVQALLP